MWVDEKRREWIYGGILRSLEKNVTNGKRKKKKERNRKETRKCSTIFNDAVENGKRSKKRIEILNAPKATKNKKDQIWSKKKKKKEA